LIGRLNNGVKFLTEMRNDALDYASKSTDVNSFQLRYFTNNLITRFHVLFTSKPSDDSIFEKRHIFNY